MMRKKDLRKSFVIFIECLGVAILALGLAEVPALVGLTEALGLFYVAYQVENF